jgi:murein DD-endopeptidase MepM/ murein hydrolase activator NlpD
MKAVVRLTPRLVRIVLMFVACYLFVEFMFPGGLLRRYLGNASNDPGVTVVSEPVGKSVRLVMTTVNCTDITLTLESASPNTHSTSPVPLTVATRGKQRLELATFAPQDPTKPWEFHFWYHWFYGCPGGEPDDTVYLLPFAPTAHYRLIQGAGGSFSHQPGTGDAYANDWNMAIGSEVRAARGGTVVGVRTDSTAHGLADRFKNSANYILIRHSDGTYGEYQHLQSGGALVKLGNIVQAGQPIGRSGNTGYTSGPHLHFGVFRIRDDYTRESLPFRVRTDRGILTELKQGQFY